MPYVIGTIVFIAIITIIGCLKIVPEATVYVIERLGKFDRVMPAGINFKVPYLERVAKKVSLKEQVADFPPQPVITSDNVTISVDSIVYYKIIDAKLFTYGVANPLFAIENLTATTLRNIIGELELDETLTSRDTINSKIREIIDEATDAWGIKVTRVELKNIMPPKEIQVSMEKQMKAERERRETLLEAEGHKQAVVLREQGNKEARILEAEGKKAAAIADAEGKAKSIELVYQAEADGLKRLLDTVGKDGVMLLKKLESLEKVGNGRATKIVVPTDLATSASTLTYAEEMLGLPHSMPINESPVDSENPGDVDICCEEKDVPSIPVHDLLLSDERKKIITDLRKETNRSFNECKDAAVQCNFDYDKALDFLKMNPFECD